MCSRNLQLDVLTKINVVEFIYIYIYHLKVKIGVCCVIAAVKIGPVHRSIKKSILLRKKQPLLWRGTAPPSHTFRNPVLEEKGLIATFAFF